MYGFDADHYDDVSVTLRVKAQLLSALFAVSMHCACIIQEHACYLLVFEGCDVFSDCTNLHIVSTSEHVATLVRSVSWSSGHVPQGQNRASYCSRFEFCLCSQFVLILIYFFAVVIRAANECGVLSCVP